MGSEGEARKEEGAERKREKRERRCNVSCQERNVDESHHTDQAYATEDLIIKVLRECAMTLW